MKKTILILTSILILVLSYVYGTATNPAGPSSLNASQGSRLNTTGYPGILVNAEAGNVTMLTIQSFVQTQTWQGYYGNVTGTIVLDDASNWTFYSWDLTEPQGEIYAANSSSVTWANIRCVNYTHNQSNGRLYAENLSGLEDWLGLAADDVDGVDETFNVTGVLSDDSTAHPTVYVGTYTINSGTCPATDTYENDGAAGTNFAEILLTDNTSIVFTAIIENDAAGTDTDVTGYNNQTWDFQMLVGDDGHDGDDAVTPYYFFVELE